MKKLFGFLKVVFVILLILLLACAGVVYYAYTKINNISKYSDKFAYDYHSYDDVERDFKSCIYYDEDDMEFIYDVPAYYMYDVITPESLKEFLALPEELKISRVAIEPDLENGKAKLYLSVKYNDLLNTCLVIDTDLVLSEDRKQLEMRYDDFFVIDDKVTDSLKKDVQLEKGSLMYVHHFPTFVPYYRMDGYYPEFGHDVGFDGENIHAEYDFEKAMRKFLEEKVNENVSFKECMEKVLLEVKMNYVAHGS